MKHSWFFFRFYFIFFFFFSFRSNFVCVVLLLTLNRICSIGITENRVNWLWNLFTDNRRIAGKEKKETTFNSHCQIEYCHCLWLCHCVSAWSNSSSNIFGLVASLRFRCVGFFSHSRVNLNRMKFTLQSGVSLCQ